MTPDVYLKGLFIGFLVFLLIGMLCKERPKPVVSYKCAKPEPIRFERIDVDREDALDMLCSMGYGKRDAENRIERAKQSGPKDFNELVNRAIRSHESDN